MRKLRENRHNSGYHLISRIARRAFYLDAGVAIAAYVAVNLCGCKELPPGANGRHYEKVRDGVTLGAYTLEAPRKMAVYVARVDLTTPGISFTATERDPKWGEPIPGANGSDGRKTIGTKRETTVDFMARRRAAGKNVEIAVNTTGFGPWERPFNHEYAGFCGWLCVDGVEVSHNCRKFGRPYFVVYKDGRVEILRRLDPAKRGDIAIAMYGNALVLKDGMVGYENIPEGTGGDIIVPRTVLGLTADMKTLVIIAVDGRQPGYSDGARYPDLVDILRGEGVADAISVDGGGSTSLVVFDHANNRPRMINHQPRGKRRKVGMNLGIVFQDATP